MEKIKCDILIIGAGPAGGVSAVTARMNYPDKEIVIVREFEQQLVPCAIPYVFGKTLGSSEKNIAPCANLTDMGISTLVSKINDIDTENKIAYSDAKEISFDKLILATGSEPFVHESLEHALRLEGVFSIPKNKTLIEDVKSYTDKKNKIIIVGSGFIGIEMAVELAQAGKNVTVVSESRHILKHAFDRELANQARDLMVEVGVQHISNDKVIEIIDYNGDSVVNAVKLLSGKIVKAEVVILATGYKPNTALAKKIGVSLGHYGGIWVDEYMRTKNHDIFAVGDCTARRDFITTNSSKVMLASTSSAEGRVAGSSLYSIRYLKGFSGTIAIFSTMIADTAFSSAGVTEEQAKDAGIDTVIGTFTCMNRHPATMPGAQEQYVKLIAMKRGGQIIGGQIIGGKETGEMINIIGVAIETRVSVYNIRTMQIATQPMLTAAPTNYPIVMAAIMAIKKIEE